MATSMIQPYLPELMLRSAAAGALALFVGVLLRAALVEKRGWRVVERTAALFALGSMAYALVSTPISVAYAPYLRSGLIALATLNSVFFWWMATALFDDDVVWRPWRLAPFAALSLLVALRLLGWPAANGPIAHVAQQALVLSMAGHAVWLSIAHYEADLVEPRRQFRIVFSGVVGLTGVAVAVVELWLGQAAPPLWLTGAHAAALLALSIVFGAWMAALPSALAGDRERGAAADAPGAARKEAIDDGDAAALDRGLEKRLEAALAEGVYRREGLTISALAAQLGCPEYRLRRLINRALGHRNFNAFLNSYRIREAQALLSDPSKARLQIAQVALELGFGSLAPFNRAFKAKTGETPTAYRQRSLLEAAPRRDDE